MKLEFDINQVDTTEFGVGLDNDEKPLFFAIPVDAKVKDTLGEMVRSTWAEVQGVEGGPREYEPSEKYGSIEYVYLSTKSAFSKLLADLNGASNLAINRRALNQTDRLFCYFTRMVDTSGRRLTGIRRATHFKGVIKKRLIQLFTDALKLLEDTVFKLDDNFDLLVDDSHVHILRPSGFEFIGKLKDEILNAVSGNVEELKKDLPFVGFSVIEQYASTHPRAARYLASIRGNAMTKGIDEDLLISSCRRQGIELTDKDGKIEVTPGSEMGFIKLLDRRLYDIELVQNTTEHYEAGSRRRVEKEG